MARTDNYSDPWNTSDQRTTNRSPFLPPQERNAPYEEGGITGGRGAAGNEPGPYVPVPSDGPSQPPVDNSAWDTDGYDKPGYTATDFGNAPSGWDGGKWADPNHQTPKYVVGRILASAGDLKNPATRAAAIQKIQQAYPGATFDGNDVITMPDGGKVDIFRGADSGEFGAAWQPVTGPGGAALPQAGGQVNSSLLTTLASRGAASSVGGSAQAGSTAMGGPDPFAATGGGVQLPNGAWVPKNHPLAAQAAGATGTTPGTGGIDPATGAPADPRAALMAQLMARSQQDLNINGQDPIIRNQTDAYSAQGQRARRDYLADTAESNSPYGTGAQRNEERMTAEKLGQDVGGFESQLVGQELTSRRAEIQSALDSMGNLLTEQDRQALQREIAQLNASIERSRIGSQDAQFYAGLNASDKHFYDQLSQQDRLAMLDDSFRRSQLGQDQSQFEDDMGFKTGDRQSYWDAVRRGDIPG